MVGMTRRRQYKAIVAQRILKTDESAHAPLLIEHGRLLAEQRAKVDALQRTRGRDPVGLPARRRRSVGHVREGVEGRLR
jgi:hypothetical protein